MRLKYHTYQRLVVTAAIVYFFGFINETFCQDAPVELIKNGMTQQQLISAIGAPLEKKENETRREETWIYPSAKFIFHEGRLVKKKSKASAANGQDFRGQGNDYNSYINNSLTSRPDFSDEEVKDIFEKISEEGGAPDAPTAGSPGSPQMAPALNKIE